MKRIALVIGLILAIGFAHVSPAAAQENGQPVVRGVLFWLDTCPHCHYVIEEVLPPLQEQYGDQLDIQLIEVDSQEKADVFYAAGAVVGLTPETIGVPLLVVGDNVLTGSVQIPEELPGLIEGYLAEGGVGWPELPGLEPFVAASEPVTGVEATAPEGEPGPVVDSAGTTDSVAAPVDEPVSDSAAPTGISGSIPAFLTLAGMVLALAFVAVMPALVRSGKVQPPEAGWVAAVIPALAAAGIVVAGYLAYVETQAVAPICGPVGDCATVQTSAYSKVLGVPVGIIGIIGYAAILAAWFAGRNGNAAARTLLLGMTVIGVVYSIYLTWLELFVIHAVCMWCISSAVIMTLLLLAAALWLAQLWTAEPDAPGETAPA